MIFWTRPLLAVAIACNSVAAFVAPSPQRLQTELSVGQYQEPLSLPPIRDISYGEESRKHRRTIYTHDDWVHHRSPDRFWKNLNAVTSSGVYKNILKEILATTGVATFVVVYNGLVGGFTDLQGHHMEPLIQSPYLPVFGLPLAPFTLASPSLGLLLSKSVRYRAQEACLQEN